MAELNFDTESKTLICVFHGQLNTLNSESENVLVNECLDNLINNNPDDQIKVTFDLNDVNFVSSAFLRICMVAAKKVHPDNFAIINTQPNIKRVFKIAGLDDKMHVS